MSSQSNKSDFPSESSGMLLLAIVALLVDERERNSDPSRMKTEILLAGVGLNHQQIAAIMNKSPDAVRMLISRMRTTPSKKQSTTKKAS